MHKYNEFRREMKRRKYRHHYRKIARGIGYGVLMVAITFALWTFIVLYTLTLASDIAV